MIIGKENLKIKMGTSVLLGPSENYEVCKGYFPTKNSKFHHEGLSQLTSCDKI